MSTPPHPSTISGGCLCASIRYTISFPSPSTWPPYCSSCQCTQCRKWLSSLHPIALTIPLAQLSLPAPESQDAGQVKVFESSEGCERRFCGRCGSALTFRNLRMMPDSVELWAGTLDEEVLIGRPRAVEEGKGAGEREGGWGTQLCDVKETLFWGNAIKGVTDGGAGAKGKKWWGMIEEGEAFV